MKNMVTVARRLRRVALHVPLKGLCLAVAALVLLASVGSANPLYVVYYQDIFSATNGSGTSPFGASTLNGAASSDTLQDISTGGASATVYLPKFNQDLGGNMLGTLTSVQLVADWALSGTLNVYNSDTDSAETLLYGYASANMTASVPGAGLNVSGLATTNQVQNQSIQQATVNYTPFALDQLTCNALSSLGASWNGTDCEIPTSTTAGTLPGPFTGLSGDSGPLYGNTLTTGLGQFEAWDPGSGTSNEVAVNFNTPQVSYTCSGPTQITCGATGNAGGVLEVIYQYDTTVAPEPLSMALTGSALVAFGLLAIKRSKRVKG